NKETTVQKGEILQRPGEINSKIYHVTSGLLRSYCIDQKGKEHIFMFAPEGWIMADYVPPERETQLFIQAIEESTLRITEKDIKKETETQKFIRRIEVLQNRVIQLMSATALERYDHFVLTYPNLSQRITQKMIASYLGVTPEALSKVKSQRRTHLKS
ncbi:MAG: Crp/Fnr family transcriptional regulator, partial [Bacteroidota bacterium]